MNDIRRRGSSSGLLASDEPKREIPRLAQEQTTAVVGLAKSTAGKQQGPAQRGWLEGHQSPYPEPLKNEQKGLAQRATLHTQSGFCGGPRLSLETFFSSREIEKLLLLYYDSQQHII